MSIDELFKAVDDLSEADLTTLRDRRDAEIITPAENERLSTVSDRIEELATDRAIALVELANVRQVSLIKVMHDLGIVGAGVR